MITGQKCQVYSCDNQGIKDLKLLHDSKADFKTYPLSIKVRRIKDRIRQFQIDFLFSVDTGKGI